MLQACPHPHGRQKRRLVLGAKSWTTGAKPIRRAIVGRPQTRSKLTGCRGASRLGARHEPRSLYVVVKHAGPGSQAAAARNAAHEGSSTRQKKSPERHAHVRQERCLGILIAKATRDQTCWPSLLVIASLRRCLYIACSRHQSNLPKSASSQRSVANDFSLCFHLPLLSVATSPSRPRSLPHLVSSVSAATPAYFRPGASICLDAPLTPSPQPFVPQRDCELTLSIPSPPLLQRRSFLSSAREP